MQTLLRAFNVVIYRIPVFTVDDLHLPQVIKRQIVSNHTYVVKTKEKVDLKQLSVQYPKMFSSVAYVALSTII